MRSFLPENVIPPFQILLRGGWVIAVRVEAEFPVQVLLFLRVGLDCCLVNLTPPLPLKLFETSLNESACRVAGLGARLLWNGRLWPWNLRWHRLVLAAI